MLVSTHSILLYDIFCCAEELYRVEEKLKVVQDIVQ